MGFEVSYREHDVGYVNPPTISWTKNLASQFRGWSQPVASMGRWYFFFVVDREWLHDKYVRCRWMAASSSAGWITHAEIWDGEFDRSSMVDFPDGSGPITKGNGTLQILRQRTGPTGFPFETWDVQADTSGGNQEKCTVIIWTVDAWNGQDGLITLDWIEINAGAGGAGNLAREDFDGSIVPEVSGTNNDYGYIGAGQAQAPIRELAAKFFVTRYRTPSRIESDAWGAILCIDPNGLRADQKGPIYYLLDGCTIRPGLTDKAGGFAATINDNIPSIDSGGNQKRIYDMTLFEADSIYIRDNDEFWIGVQQGVIGSSGPVLDNSIGRENSWAAGTGGRQWLLGGWITKRYYNYDAQTRVTATLEGKDYMDLWKENHFGTEDVPRDYTDVEAIDILQVIVDILHDINTIQDDDYGFRSHPSLFPGSPLTADVLFASATIPVQDTDSFSPGSAFIWDNDIRAGETVTITVVNPTNLTIAPGLSTGFSVGENAWIAMTADLTGTPFLREFNNHPCFSSMSDLCERADFEWKITPYPAGTTPSERRRLEFYPRATAPVSGAEHILFSDSIRDLPSIMVGNTTNLLTNALITGKPVTLPDPDGTWTDSGAWLAKSSRAEIYHRASIPPPPNASYPPYARASYGDVSLFLDHEGYPALNFQKDDSSIFDMYLSFYAEGNDIAVSKLDLDLRKWRRVKLRFRHATALSATLTLTVNNYLNLIGKTIVVTATGIADEAIPRVEYLVEGIDWFAATSNGATATSIRDAINALAWADATVFLSVVTVTGAVTGFLSYIASDAGADLSIDVSNANLYRLSLHTFNPVEASGANVWNQKFFYDFGTGTKQSSTIFNDPVLSNRDVVTQRLWSEIDILLPEVNPDGTIGDGTLASLSDDTYMHGWRAVHLDGPPVTPDTTADPTNIDFVAIYVNCKERGPGGTITDAPGDVSRSLSGTNKNFVAALNLAGAVFAGTVFINVTNAQRMAGDYAFGVPAGETRTFTPPYPRYVLWRAPGGTGDWEEIRVAAIATSGSLFPGGNNVYLATPLQNNYASGQVLLRGGWNFSFGRLHFTPGSINKDGGAAAHLANPKRFRLISSDDVEYAVDVEGLADQTLLDAVSLQAVKLTLDGDPRRRIGTRVRPYLDGARFAAGLPTTFHGESMIIEIAEHHVVDVDFYSVFLVSPLGTRARERLMAMIQGTQESKLKQTSYGTRFRGKFQPK